MSEAEEQQGVKWIKVALVALPVCLFLSAGGAVWYHWHSDTQEQADPALAIGGEAIGREEMADSLKKLGWLGERDWATADGRKVMRQVLSFVEGTWSPQNYGFVVESGVEVSFETDLWPMIWVDVTGGERKSEVVVVAAPYDGDDGSLVALMTAARAVREMDLPRTVRFVAAPERVVMDAERANSEELLTDAESCVAFLRLDELADGLGRDGAWPLSVAGKELRGERALRVDGVLRVAGEEGQGAWIEEVYGAWADEALLLVGPGVRESGEPDADLRALVGRTRLLVEVLSGLAREG